MRSWAGVALGIGVVVGLGMLLNLPGRILDGLIFQPTRDLGIRPDALGIPVEDVFLETEDGVRIHSYFLPAPEASRAILFFHGNAGNASHRLPNAAGLRARGAHVLLADYRGYGRSQGRPSEAGAYADARANLAYLRSERGIPEERIVLFGRSLGGAVAVDLAQDRPLAGVILESTFSSVADVARSLFGGWVAPLTRGRFDSRVKIQNLRSPLLFLHGDRDRTVPIEFGQRLFAAAPGRKEFETLPGAGHNDTVALGGEAYFERIGRFLDEVAPP